MRVGASILLVNGYCYQSYGWNLLRPLGWLQQVVKFLELYEVDEISIIRPIKGSEESCNYFRDLDSLKALRCTTPVSFGGGIRDVAMIERLHDLPIERLILSSAFFEANTKLLTTAVNLYGRQAIQCCIPFRATSKGIEFYVSRENNWVSSGKYDENYFLEYANEVVLYDTAAEGARSGYLMDEIFNYFSDLSRVVICGGVGISESKIADKKQVACALIENRVLHNEYSITGYRA